MNDHVTIDTTRVPVVVAKGGEAFANSRDVASFFDKQHAHVLRDIDHLISSEPSLGLSKFGETRRTDAQNGQTYRTYEMTRDGFTLLAMGFTGAKALKWKLAYIDAFNAMEAELRRVATSAPAIDLNDPAQLRGLLLSYSDKADKLQQRVEELLPAAVALNRIATADGSLCMMDAAKALQVRPKDLVAYLQANSWIYRRAGGDHWIGRQDRINAGLLEHKVTTVSRPDGSEKITEQVRVTPKGMERLAKGLGSRA